MIKMSRSVHEWYFEGKTHVDDDEEEEEDDEELMYIDVKKKYQNPRGGLNAAGRKYYNRTTGSHLKPPVKTPHNASERARQNSFCHRMRGVKGPLMKDGKPTRKKLALQAWHCGSS
jgi:hypothetical protein